MLHTLTHFLQEPPLILIWLGYIVYIHVLPRLLLVYGLVGIQGPQGPRITCENLRRTIKRLVIITFTQPVFRQSLLLPWTTTINPVTTSMTTLKVVSMLKHLFLLAAMASHSFKLCRIS